MESGSLERVLLKSFNRDKNYKPSKTVFTVFGWILSFSSIICIILIIFEEYFIINLTGLITVYIYYGVISYFLYLLIEFNSPSSRFIFLKVNERIDKKMEEFFKALPIIKINAICYHMEKRLTREEYKTVEVETFRETKILNYNYCRDISGVLNIKINKDNKKYYIQLELTQEVFIADIIIQNQYNNIIASLTERNKFRDKLFKIEESLNIEGVKYYNMIKLSDDEPCFAHNIWFIFSIFLLLAEVYKLYINCISINKTFALKKIISNRSIINNIEYDRENPRIIFDNNDIPNLPNRREVIVNNEGINSNEYILRNNNNQNIYNILNQRNINNQENNEVNNNQDSKSTNYDSKNL